MASLNDNFREPLYKQLEKIILKKIKDQEFLVGAQLPGSRQLAQIYGINRLTVNKALNNLSKKGILYKKPSSGTYVRKNINTDLTNTNFDFSNSDLFSIIKKQKPILNTKVITKDVFSDVPYFQEKLNLSKEDKIFGIHRLRLVKNRPIALECSYLPIKYFEDIYKIDFNHVELYDYMNSKGHLAKHNDMRLIIMHAPKKEANLMMIKQNASLVKVQCIHSDYFNNIVEYSESYLLPEDAKLHFNIKSF